MNRSSESVERTTISEGLDIIEVEGENDVFETHFDRSDRSASLAIVEMVAALGNTSPLEVTPISASIDTDALDTLLSSERSNNWGCDSITLQYEGFEVTVDGEGRIQAVPLEDS